MFLKDKLKIIGIVLGVMIIPGAIPLLVGSMMYNRFRSKKKWRNRR